MTLRVAVPCIALTALVGGGQELPPTKRLPPASANAAPGVTYRDLTAAAGLSQFRHLSGTSEKNYLIETTGSGVALWDFDNDGLLDIYLVNGSTVDRVQRGDPAPPAALYHNNGDGTFTDVTVQRGVANERWGQGVCAGDVDNDGFEDLYVTNFGKNRLYHNDRGRAFSDVADTAHVAVDSWSTGCAFGDFDGDGWLDLFVAGYVSLDLAHLPPPATASASSPVSKEPAPPATDAGARMGASYTPGAAACTYRSERVMCGPRGLKGAPDHLFRNNHDGTFTDVSREAGVADATGLYGFGVAWFDMDDDGRPDLFVANDSGPNYVYRNLGNGRFEDVSYPSGAALDAQGREQAHMGVAVGDYDNDGRDDLHVTNFANDFNVLYHNDSGRVFSDVTSAVGLILPTTPFLGWGTDFLDYDNDGWLDLLVVNGHVYPSADRFQWNSSYAQRALLFRNLKGARFEDIGAAAGEVLTTPRVARGSAIGDLDNDGGLDIVISNLDAPPT
ncbi:MAG TPA: VCBS repeat-containing protein, partial [Vicinamibacterales bacterium]